jgi:hypothetical protein
MPHLAGHIATPGDSRAKFVLQEVSRGCSG